MMKNFLPLIVIVLLSCTNSTNNDIVESKNQLKEKIEPIEIETSEDLMITDNLPFQFDTSLKNGPVINYWLENQNLLTGKENRFRIKIEGVSSNYITLATPANQSKISKGTNIGDYLLNVNENADHVVIAIQVLDSITYERFLLTELKLKTMKN